MAHRSFIGLLFLLAATLLVASGVVLAGPANFGDVTLGPPNNRAGDVAFASSDAHATLLINQEGEPVTEPSCPLGLVYFGQLDACVVAVIRNQRETGACLTSLGPGTWERSRWRYAHEVMTPRPPYQVMKIYYGEWSEWSEWSVCTPSCEPWPGYAYDPALNACWQAGPAQVEEELRSCSTPRRSQKRQRSRSQTYLRTSADGEPQIIYGEWSAWSDWTSCGGSSGGGSGSVPTIPKVGAHFILDLDLICSSSDTGYAYGKYTILPAAAVGDSGRNAVINAYKQLQSQRCPELGGGAYTGNYPYWVNQMGLRLMGMGYPTLTGAEAIAWVQTAIAIAGAPERLEGMHEWCQQAADAAYGANVVGARFVSRDQPGYTGNTCVITVVY